MSHTLPKLPYPDDALEPHIDARTMGIHHTKHHQAYVDKLNQALAKAPDFAAMDLTSLCKSIGKVPADVQAAVRNNGGGHYNHTMFWTLLSADGGGKPSGELAQAIDRTFGSFNAFVEEFSNAALTRFGSGWVWLCVQNGNLLVCSTPNQDNPLMEGKGTPILGLDVWEHAYYLNYQNRRPDYVKAFWNIVNWDEVAKRYKDAK
ncbi:superoxide dismutase [Simkania negevensis]|uniref:Superoxide dismutase n=1 Tax=Simkania negevensis TaxID=83561 RepID=A0ABS3APL1_9BACT|nr:superoxide dismutase [Simkania negevensis]